MIIEKHYKFYAAHRNETLQDKCCNLHGHRYGLRCFFDVERTGDISTLFATFDQRIEPWLKDNYDHGLLIHQRDPLYDTLLQHMARTGETLRLKILPGPTSVENLCYVLFCEITAMGFHLDRLEVQETDTSIVSYSRQDWITDSRLFARQYNVPERLENRLQELKCQLPTTD